MARYKLGIFNKSEGRVITLDDIIKLEKLEDLDKFTTQFTSEEELKVYLLNKGLITQEELKQNINIMYKYDGKIPNDINELTKLDGVGRKTANVVLSTLYNKPYFAVDTHVTRVTKRLGLVPNDYDTLKIEEEMYKKVPKERISRTHHQFVLFGRYYCKCKKPMCDTCKLKNICKKELQS